MSFTDGKPFTVTAEHVTLNWSGGPNGRWFRCNLCGHKFKAGDVARWQFTNDIPGAGGNPLVCEQCDGSKEKIVAEWKSMHEHAKPDGKMWWFFRHLNR